jgi:hypothetical protein
MSFEFEQDCRRQKHAASLRLGKMSGGLTNAMAYIPSSMKFSADPSGSLPIGALLSPAISSRSPIFLTSSGMFQCVSIELATGGLSNSSMPGTASCGGGARIPPRKLAKRAVIFGFGTLRESLQRCLRSDPGRPGPKS